MVWGFFKSRKATVLADDAYLEIIRADIAVLARKRFQTLRTNEYGVTEYGKWWDAWRRYCQTALWSKARERGLPTRGERWDDITRFPEHSKSINGKRILGMLVERTEAYRVTAQGITGISPTEFELAVADKLNSIGWNAHTTRASGDQGADVVARSGNSTLVVQCKQYSKAIGNRAVQEIAAAREFYHAQIAAVVSTSSFTNSAEELANANSVRLLHFVEIADRLAPPDV